MGLDYSRKTTGFIMFNVRYKNRKIINNYLNKIKRDTLSKNHHFLKVKL